MSHGCTPIWYWNSDTGLKRALHNEGHCNDHCAMFLQADEHTAARGGHAGEFGQRQPSGLWGRGGC